MTSCLAKKKKMAEKWIKWNRTSGRLADSPSERAKKMREQIVAESYRFWRAGELFRVTEFRPADVAMDLFESTKDVILVPELNEGDIVMYLGWFANVEHEFRPNDVKVVSGPKWLIHQKTCMVTLPPEILEPVKKEQEDGAE